MLKLCLINGVAFAKLLDLSQAGNGLMQVRYGSHCGSALRPPDSMRRGGFVDPALRMPLTMEATPQAMLLNKKNTMTMPPPLIPLSEVL